MRPLYFSILAASVVLFSPARNDASENGALAVYGDQFQGRPTASGAPYDAGKLTAAHAALPFATVVRVANFETGRMVDVVINDRKGADGRILTLSRAAADAVELPANRTAPGSLMVVQQTPAFNRSAPVPAPAAAYVPAAASGAVPLPMQAAGAPGARKFRPFGGIFAKEAPTAPTAASQVVTVPVQYGFPAVQYDPRFSRPVLTPSVAGGAGPGELTPMNAGSAVAFPAARQAPAVMSPAAVPAAVVARTASPEAPYRVQFGAFRRDANANELAVMLGSAGIPSAVFTSPGSSLNLVVTQGGFRTAEEAQRWIDFEGVRRGWVERPVVIR